VSERARGPARLDGVARAYLGRGATGARVIVVLGLDRGEGAETTVRELETEGARLGVLGADDAALRVVGLGRLAPGHLDALLPPRTPRGAHGLLVCLPPDSPGALRIVHALALWRWGLAARHVRCLWPGPRARARAVADRLRERLAWTGEDGSVEVLAVPEGWGGATHRQLLGQVLLSTLNASRGRPRARGARGLQGRG